MYDRRAAGLATAWRSFVATVLVALALSASVHGRAQAAEAAPPAAAVAHAPMDWHHSLTKALSYQAVVVSTDQVLYWAIVTGTTESELEFLAANAVSGVAYYVGFDSVWHAAGLDPAGGGSEVSVGKAVAYRVFDTARVLAVTLAIGTPLAASLEVTAAIAATRTLIYMLHDYAWSLADRPG